MAEITQQPTEVDLVGVAGSPFVLTVLITATDSDDAPIPWDDFSDWAVVINGPTSSGPAQAIPTITNPGSGDLLVSWSAAQTTALATQAYTWALQIVISDEGPYSLIAGNLLMGSATAPGSSTSASADLSVTVGTATATVDVTLGGGGGGSVASVNGQTGVVVLTAAEVGADASGAAATAQSNAEAFATTAAGTAQSNAETFATSAVATETSRAEAAEALAALKANNLSDLASESTARTNLGLGSAATQPSSAFDAAGAAATAQTNAETFATSAVATETTRAETAEALALQKANNLSDVGDAGSSRYNLAMSANTVAQVASTTNVSLSAPGATIDSYSIQTNDVVLLTGQTTASQNGPWQWNGAASALTRTHQYPSGGLIKHGLTCAVANGTVYGNTSWILNAASAGITVDTTSTTWTKAALVPANNLSDVADAGSARANIHTPMLTPAAAVSTTNVSSLTTSTTTIDGYSLASGDLVLLTGQTSPTQNGLWQIPASGSWSRPTEFASGATVKGRLAIVMNGSTYQYSVWMLYTATAGVIIDSASQVWVSTFTQAFAEQAYRTSITMSNIAGPTASVSMETSGTMYKFINLGPGVNATDSAQYQQIPATTVITAIGTTSNDTTGTTLNTIVNTNLVLKLTSTAAAAGFTSAGGVVAVAASGGTAYITFTGVSGSTLTGLTLSSGTSSWTVTNGTSTILPAFACNVTGPYDIECIGGGGSGGSGGSASANTTAQAGSAGGGQGESKKGIQPLTAGQYYTCAVGAGGAAVNGGASGGHAGTVGNGGSTTTFFGASNLVAAGGGGGAASGSNSTTGASGGGFGGTGAVTPSATFIWPGYGGNSNFELTLSAPGGPALGRGGGGGGAGGQATTGTSGLGGGGGTGGGLTAAGGGAAGSNGGNASSTGGTGTQGQDGTGAGGGGGGGGADASTPGGGGPSGRGGIGGIYITGPLTN